MNPEHIELRIQTLEERPSAGLLRAVRDEVRQFVAAHLITAQDYSAKLGRLKKVEEELKAA